MYIYIYIFLSHGRAFGIVLYLSNGIPRFSSCVGACCVGIFKGQRSRSWVYKLLLSGWHVYRVSSFENVTVFASLLPASANLW